MKRIRLILTALALTVMMGLVFLWGGVWAAEKVLKGDIWVTMSQDEKVAYIWGAGDVVDIEQELMEIYPELRVENLSLKCAEAAADIPMNDIIARVDNWYEANPDRLDTSVIKVIWDLMIRPNLTTGIAGRPLQ